MMSESFVALAVATLGGAAVGVERQWSGHASGPDARFAGIRTFALLGALAGLAGQLWAWGAMQPAVVLLAGAGALVVAAYVRASQRDADGTTEVAAFVVLAAGTASGLGRIEVGSGVIAVTVMLLVEKSRLHALVGHMADAGIAAAARFAVMAVVILPLLPEGPFGPFGGIRPRQLWSLVLFFSGLSFSGYLARALVGDQRGYAAAGVLGGLVSSTQVTLSYARLSRTHPALAAPLAEGVIGANTMLFPRVALAAAVLNGSVAATLLPVFAAPFLIGLALVAFSLRRRARGDDQSAKGPPNPLQVLSAMQMAAAFQAVLVIMHVARQWFAASGVIAAAVALGATDVDALTMSMTTTAASGELPSRLAALAIATGIVSNTCVKVALSVVVGRGRFRLYTAGGLTAMGLALGAGVLWWP